MMIGASPLGSFGRPQLTRRAQRGPTKVSQRRVSLSYQNFNNANENFRQGTPCLRVSGKDDKVVDGGTKPLSYLVEKLEEAIEEEVLEEEAVEEEEVPEEEVLEEQNEEQNEKEAN